MDGLLHVMSFNSTFCCHIFAKYELVLIDPALETESKHNYDDVGLQLSSEPFDVEGYFLSWDVCISCHSINKIPHKKRSHLHYCFMSSTDSTEYAKIVRGRRKA